MLPAELPELPDVAPIYPAPPHNPVSPMGDTPCYKDGRHPISGLPCARATPRTAKNLPPSAGQTDLIHTGIKGAINLERDRDAV
jgi:hypothetical protein